MVCKRIFDSAQPKRRKPWGLNWGLNKENNAPPGRDHEA
jgi:hypothetical protein